MTFRRTLSACLVVALAVVTTACSSSATSDNNTSEQRIVSLTAGLTEIVYALGLGDNVVGKDLSSTYADAAGVPLVTNGHDVSAESILQVRPTIVLADQDTRPVEALEQIRSAGIQVEIVNTPKSLDEIVTRVTKLGTLLNVEKRAAAVADALSGKLDSTDSALENVKVAFLYLRGGAGVYLIGTKGSGADVVIKATGAQDAGSSLTADKTFVPLTPEALVSAQPDIILMTSTGLKSVGGEDGLLGMAGIPQTPAGKNKRFVTVEDGLLFSLGPRTPELVAQLRQAFRTKMGLVS